jgi:hypothetical protein
MTALQECDDIIPNEPPQIVYLAHAAHHIQYDTIIFLYYDTTIS